MLGILVFATQQPERSLRRRTGHNAGLVHADAGQYHHAMTALCKDVCLLIYKIFGSQHPDVLHGGYLIGIMKTGIDNCNRHALPLEPSLVQFITITHLYLANGKSIDTVRMYTRLVNQRIASGRHHRTVIFGSYPDFFRSADKR